MNKSIVKKIGVVLVLGFLLTFVCMGAYRLASKTYDKIGDKLNEPEITDVADVAEE